MLEGTFSHGATNDVSLMIGVNEARAISQKRQIIRPIMNENIKQNYFDKELVSVNFTMTTPGGN